jgi:hypothetical protein
MTEESNTGAERSGKKIMEPYTLTGGKLRLSQVITTFGPGAILDLPRESIMVAGLDNWPDNWTPEQSIRDVRLESSLGLEKLYSPAPASSRVYPGGLPCVRFPRVLICSGCGLFTRSKKCKACNADAYPARLIAICPAGHAEDFPWEWWAHRGSQCTGPGRPRLRLISQGRTAALADLEVRCETCKKPPRSLGGALGPTALRDLDCSGERPWLIGSQPEQCHEKLRSVLRGASNVYFSSTLSALSIPPWSDPIQVLLNEQWQTLGQLPLEILPGIIENLKEFSGINPNDVVLAIQQRKSNTTTIGNLRREEYLALRNPGNNNFYRPLSDFQIRGEPVPDLFQTQISQVVLASRLREVTVLRGFTRIDPPDPENAEQTLAPISQNPLTWLPAVEHRGEGIFLEFIESRVSDWERRPAVQQRMSRLNAAYTVWREQRNLPPAPPMRPRAVLLHTLAHLLIRQLSLECGYSSTSLRERIYSGVDMCGLLIYTASADADGSLGGLVQQGTRQRFSLTLQALLEHAQWCSADPLCTEHDPTKTGKLNGAACHVCSLVAETSCERGNHFLDRAFIIDLPGVTAGTGYF